MVKARVMNSDGWSALAEARFVVDQVPAAFENVTISKVHYRPAAANEDELAAGYQSRKDFEFVELLNLSDTTIDLAGVRFNKGIQFEFASAEKQSIAARERLFIARNPSAFAMRYGADLPIAGSFSGSLSNDGELLRLVNSQDDVLQELEYNDAEPWPVEADGDGPFLALKEVEKAATRRSRAMACQRRGRGAWRYRRYAPGHRASLTSRGSPPPFRKALMPHRKQTSTTTAFANVCRVPR